MFLFSPPLFLFAFLFLLSQRSIRIHTYIHTYTHMDCVVLESFQSKTKQKREREKFGRWTGIRMRSNPTRTFFFSSLRVCGLRSHRSPSCVCECCWSTREGQCRNNTSSSISLSAVCGFGGGSGQRLFICGGVSVIFTFFTHEQEGLVSEQATVGSENLRLFAYKIWKGAAD